MERLFEALQGTLGEALPGVFGALIILLAGWIIAVLVKVILRKTLRLLKLNEHTNLNLEPGIATGGYFVVLLVTLLAVFDQLGLEVVSQPLQVLLSQVFDYLPKLIGGTVLMLVAWLCARIIKQIATTALDASGIDKRVEAKGKPLSETVGEIAFWLVFLIFLPGILGVFGLEGLLLPAQTMVDQMVSAVPNILAAGVIIFVGWLIAKIFRDIVVNVFTAMGIDKLGEKAGIKGKMGISKIAGQIVFFLIFIPAIISGLSALKISAIADPATEMLSQIITLIPNFIGALAIIMITYFVAKPVSAFVGNLLNASGIDKFPDAIGLTGAKVNLSQLGGKVVFFFMMLFATVEATNRLGFAQISDMATNLVSFGGQVLLGSMIIAAGLWIANLVSTAMNKASKDGYTPMATLVRVIILGLVLAMGLRAMGLANDIVNMAFGLTLGATAVAFAISFGVGGREAAGKQMEYWLSKLRKGNNRKAA
ncbi:mechanosensitive ion channel [Candidatus Omnitrophota bacterium]